MNKPDKLLIAPRSARLNKQGVLENGQWMNAQDVKEE
jgi:hypothetical protein